VLLGTGLVTTKNAFQGLENPSSATSYSGRRIHGTKTCFG
jgi:hypothetical protein